MLIGLVCAAVAIALLFPETSVGKPLRRLLVELPAEMLSQLTRARVIFALLVLGVIVGVIALLKSDGTILIAQGAPDALAWINFFDIATYIDAIGLAVVFGATVRFRAIHMAMRSAAARLRQLWLRSLGALHQMSTLASRSRSRRTRRTVTRSARRDTEDGPAPGFVLPEPRRVGVLATGEPGVEVFRPDLFDEAQHVALRQLGWVARFDAGDHGLIIVV